MDTKREEEWPEYLDEREPETDVEAIEERLKEQGVKVHSRVECDLKASMEPGNRLSIAYSELEVEMCEGGIVALLVGGVPVWRGPSDELAQIVTYSSSEDKTLCGVCVNGKVVWVRR